jgi:hypothetical protein
VTTLTELIEMARLDARTRKQRRDVGQVQDWRNKLRVLLPDHIWQQLGVNPMTLHATRVGWYATEPGRAHIEGHTAEVVAIVCPHDATGTYRLSVSAPVTSADDHFTSSRTTLLSEYRPERNPAIVGALLHEWTQAYL